MAARIRSLRNSLSPIDEASRDDLVPGDVVTVQALDAATTYAWAIAFAPEGSTATFTGSTSAVSPGNFTVDLEGPYLIRLIVDAALPTESTQYVRLRALTEFAGLKLVAAGERRDTTGIIPVDVDVEGWANEQNFNHQRLLEFIKPYAQSGRFLQVDANAGTQGYGNFPTIQEALDYAVLQGASALTPWVVAVHFGYYTEDVTFWPHVHVVGWPGEGKETNQILGLFIDGQHTAPMANANDMVALRGLTLGNTTATTSATLTKTGAGRLQVGSCYLATLGNDPNQGPSLAVTGGATALEGCTLTQSNANTLSWGAVLLGGSTSLTRCQVEGPNGVRVNPTMLPSVTIQVSDTVVRTDGPCFDGACDHLLIERSSLTSDVSKNAIRFRNLGGAPYLNPVILSVRHTSLDDTLVYDTTNLTTTLYLPGSLDYLNLSYPAGAPGVVRATTQSKTHYYDNAFSGLTAENVQDAIDEVAATAAIAPLVYSKNMPEVPDDTVRYRGWAPIACVLVAIRVRMMTLNTQGNYRLFITNNATGNTVLSAAFFDMNTLVAGAVQPVGLTGTLADLTFATLDAWTVALVSDDPLFDGEAIYIEMVFNPATAAASAAADLATTLLVGNITGGRDIVLTTGDEIVGQTDVVLRSTGVGSNIELFPDAAGAVVINGKLTVTGLIDPTGLVLTQAPAPPTTATEGALFVSDGSGGLTAGNLYYRPASNGTPLDLFASDSPTQFIFRPGGVAGDNVYTNFALLYADLAATPGQKELVFDNSASGNPITIPSGSYDFTSTRWTSKLFAFAGFDPVSPQITLTNPTQITNLREIDGLRVTWTSAVGTPPLRYNSGGNEFLYLRNAFINVSFGMVPLVLVADGGGPSPTNLYIVTQSSVRLGGANAEWLGITGTSQVTAILASNSSFADDSVVGAVGTQLTVTSDTTSNANSAQPNMLGTANFNLSDDASQLGYTANGSGGSWGGVGIPPSVEDALDRLANFVAGIHGVIP